MSQEMVRVKVRCHSCRTVAQLTPEHYRALVRGEEVSLSCPRCNHQFTFSAMGPARRANVDYAPPVVVPEPEPPPAPAPVPSPAFPPPPFALLRLGDEMPVPANAPAPQFPLLGEAAQEMAPVAPHPSPYPAPVMRKGREEVRTAGSGEKVSFNERWKRLPPWVQWTVVGVMILVLGVIILALPSGGSNNASADAPTSRPAQSSSTKPDAAHPAENATPPRQKP
jgi:hypothetical protein